MRLLRNLLDFVKGYLKEDPLFARYSIIIYFVLSGGTLWFTIDKGVLWLGIILMFVIGAGYIFFWIWRVDYWEDMRLAAEMIRANKKLKEMNKDESEINKTDE
jgi:hypothetical protein